MADSRAVPGRAVMSRATPRLALQAVRAGAARCSPSTGTILPFFAGGRTDADAVLETDPLPQPYIKVHRSTSLQGKDHCISFGQRQNPECRPQYCVMLAYAAVYMLKCRSCMNIRTRDKMVNKSCKIRACLACITHKKSKQKDKKKTDRQTNKRTHQCRNQSTKV